ncbi:MAG: hypothetical protein DHS20C11_17630 [Lysobacteraceae bacterium]|nr:MAG: hypothetical protein DHS20C11_17630 [Xanthomonadaceae bacterium]
MLHCDAMQLTPHTLADHADDTSEPFEAQQTILVLAHVEQSDVERPGRTLRHAYKNIKWLSRKRQCDGVVIHSFAHLSSSNAPVDFSRQLLEQLGERLQNNGLNAQTTPFGVNNELHLHVQGEPMAKYFNEI